jgi:cation:H+ antiporter
MSALDGAPEISLGNALGANIVNVAMILGIVLLFSPITVPSGSIRRDIPVAMLAPVGLALLLIDGRLSRFEALLLLATFAVWLWAIVQEARRERSAVVGVLGETQVDRAMLDGVLGFALLITAGKLIVDGGTGIARSYWLSEFVIGATIVAAGTTMPELLTALIARWRGHDEVSLGTVLGSNIFNGLAIVGVAGAITPIKADFQSVAPALVIGHITVALTRPSRLGVIDRWRGGMLLFVYAIILATILQAR